MELNKLNIEIKGEVLLGDTKIKCVEGGFGECQKSILANDVAKLCNKRTKHIQKLITNNIHRFNNNDLIDLYDENFKVRARDLGLITSNGQKHCYLLSKYGCSKLSSLMKGQSHIFAIILKEYFNCDIYSEPTNTKECEFYEKLSQQLIIFDIWDGETQYSCCNNKYRIDYYIPSLNIAIEYDENDHKYYTYDNQEGRQKEIENELNCKFIRVSDKYSINTAIAIVFKNLLDMKLL